MTGATMEHFIPGKVAGTRTVRVRDREYERLRALGTVRESFSDVIERLLDFYEAYNGGVHSNDPEGFEGADLPENPVYRRVALDHFTGTLALGEDVSFTIGFDPLASPLGRRGKGLVAFYKDGRRFCLFRVGKEHLWLYFPTDRRDTELEGWELVQNVFLDNFLEDGGMHLIRRQYQTM
ncbi:hypothetical protein E2N92_11390 [Methanofollis formosanus]|uniref:Uncharacterized protein n=1 Tax=Methanofollis formosanus TaxID=299308 RepID=A0A8G1EHG9_9EURY|nr:antitoxin VapB family protein [Methanofollis formosanus]QYZ79982.1 hypothetical protein E2N92_11390 [Methanofollis formosanus]